MFKSASKAGLVKERNQSDADLVKSVMETSGGGNAALAKKIHARFDRCASAISCICEVHVASAGMSQLNAEVLLRARHHHKSGQYTQLGMSWQTQRGLQGWPKAADG
jgi:hypothetical protein